MVLHLLFAVRLSCFYYASGGTYSAVSSTAVSVLLLHSSPERIYPPGAVVPNRLFCERGIRRWTGEYSEVQVCEAASLA